MDIMGVNQSVTCLCVTSIDLASRLKFWRQLVNLRGLCCIDICTQPKCFNFIVATPILTMKSNFRTLACRRRVLSVSIIVNVIIIVVSCFISKSDSIYSNHFAVHVPTGESRASEIASKHGFTNMGQVSFYKPFVQLLCNNSDRSALLSLLLFETVKYSAKSCYIIVVPLS